MEALAAIGLAGNLLTFIDFGFQILVAAKDIHGSATGHVKSDDDVAFVTRELRDLCVSLNVTKTPISRMTDPEASLARLATQCQRWSDDLLSLLDSTRAADPRNRRNILRAAWSNVRNSKKKETLEISLAACRDQLGLHLANLSRSEAGNRLNTLMALSRTNCSELESLKQAVNQLRSSLDAHQYMNSMVIEGSQALLEDSERAILTARQRKFVTALHSDKLYHRFDSIESAYLKTFDWLLEDEDYEPIPDHWGGDETNIVQVGAAEDRHLRFKARQDFTRWLGKEPGIFHITGKPGAGKSTLMKFICEHPRTWEYLTSWSARRELVITKSFITRLELNIQNDLQSLLRGILHQLLSAAPALLPVAFPSMWDSRDDMETMHLTSLDVEVGLDLIFENSSIVDTHRFVLFIDGLDEFDGSHSILVRKLSAWAMGSPDHVKLCVSSREWNIFQDAFMNCSRLRIHEYTRDGIAVMTTDRLARCRPALPNINATVDLVNEIVDKAQGVFIWVAIVLKVLEEGIINGDRIAELKAKVRAFPSELNDLYGHLFHTIHPCDRKKAYEALLFTKHLFRTFGSPARLLDYYFLDHGLRRGPYDMPELATCLDTTSRRINGRCKGFLEIHVEKLNWIQSNHVVEFMHLTAAEFLNKQEILSSLEEYVPAFDCLKQLCQIRLAQWKIFPALLAIDRIHVDTQICEAIDLACSKTSCLCSRHPNRAFFEFLEECQELIRVHSGYKHLQLPLTEDPPHLETRLWPYMIYDIYFTWDIQVLVIAARFQLYEYFDWRLNSNISNGINVDLPVDILLASAVQGMVAATQAALLDLERFKNMADFCFHHGVCPNDSITKDSHISWWHWILCFFISSLPYPFFYEHGTWVTILQKRVCTYNMEKLRSLFNTILKRGGKSDFSVSFRTRRDAEKEEVHLCVNSGPDVFLTPEGMSVNQYSPIASFAQRQGGSLTLEEVFRFWFHNEDYRDLDELLQKNEELRRTLEEIDDATDL